VLSNGGTKTYKRLLQKSGLGGDSSDDELDDAQDETAGLLSAQEQVDNRVGDDDADDEDRFPRRDSRSRSQSVRRKVMWYKRPSPMWSVSNSSALAIVMVARANG